MISQQKPHALIKVIASGPLAKMMKQMMRFKGNETAMLMKTAVKEWSQSQTLLVPVIMGIELSIRAIFA